ncbi:MAG: PAAR-like domain-containing protein [Polyangiaceae bacterium]
MGSVTACMMDVITEKSGHSMTGLAVSVCLTPAAPSPLPIPYPTMATVSEGVIDECLRTKIDGAKVLTVGSCTKNCHGNEPGTLKEVVSLNTAGPCFPIMGAPIVFIELGMAGITLSPGFMNKNPIPGIGGSASGAGGGGGGGGGAGGGAGGPPGSSTSGPSNGGGGGGGNNSAAAPPNAPAAPGAEGQATATHPVDVVTGAMFTGPLVDFTLLGPMWLHFTRSYSTSAVRRKTSLGWGWSCGLDWTAHRESDRLTLIDDEGRETVVPYPSADETVILPYSRKLSQKEGELLIEIGDDLIRVLREDETRRYRLSELRDGSGNSIEIHREEGEIVAIIDSVGRRAERSVDGAWIRWDLSVTDEEGKAHTKRLVTYELNDERQLCRVIDAGGAETVYEYDAEHYLVREKRSDGLVWHFVYAEVEGQKRCVEGWGDIPGRDVLAELGDPESGGPNRARGVFHARLEYGPEPRASKVTDACGYVHRYWGNALGLVERYLDPRGVDHLFSYDDVGKLLGHTIGGVSVRRHYDVTGTPTAVRIGDGRSVHSRFDPKTETVTTTLADGRRARRRFQKGKTVELVDPLGRKSEFAYNERGLRSSVAYPGFGKDEIAYDAHGNIAVYKRANGGEYRYTFDLFGLPVRLEDPCGAVYSIKYGSRGEIVEVRTPSGQVAARAYDRMGRLVTMRHGSGEVSTWTYVADSLVEQTLPDGSKYRRGYDALQRLRWIENPAGERHRFEYDEIGQLVRETTFTGSVREYERDATGAIVRQRTASAETRITRDAVGKILRREHSDGTFETFSYDRFGYIESAANAHSKVSFQRDDQGKVVRETQACGGWEFAVDYQHDALGREVNRSFSTGWGIRRAFDETSGDIRSVAAVPAKEGAPVLEIDFERDLLGREIARRRKDTDCAVRIQRDAMGLPKSVSVLGPKDDVLCERTYEWDKKGPLAAVHDALGGSRRYDLDALGRPVKATGLSVNEEYRYSPQGGPLPANENVRLGAGSHPLEIGDAAYLWDAAGRLSERRSADPRKAWAYRYDGANRLIQATRGDGLVVRYFYDVFGRRLCETAAGASTWFGWDRDVAVEERPTSGGGRRRLFGEDGFTPVAEGGEDGQWQLFATDAASTPFAGIGGDGAVSRLDLTTWGQVASASGDATNLRFAGQRADATTGLHYNRHRYYAPELGTFLTPDPLGIGASPFDIGFVPNATYYLDPLGLLTVILASGDPVVDNANRAAWPGANFITADNLQANSLAGERDVIVSSHGSPGSIGFGSAGQINGQQLAQRLNAAGFDRTLPGARIAVAACNSATPGAGTPSVAQGVADGAQVPTYGARATNVTAAQNGTPSNGQAGFGQNGAVWVDNGSWVGTRPGANDTGVTTHGSTTTSYSPVGSGVFP